jgi:hypothetical protein
MVRGGDAAELELRVKCDGLIDGNLVIELKDRAVVLHAEGIGRRQIYAA